MHRSFMEIKFTPGGLSTRMSMDLRRRRSHGSLNRIKTVRRGNRKGEGRREETVHRDKLLGIILVTTGSNTCLWLSQVLHFYKFVGYLFSNRKSIIHCFEIETSDFKYLLNICLKTKVLSMQYLYKKKSDFKVTKYRSEIGYKTEQFLYPMKTAVV